MTESPHNPMYQIGDIVYVREDLEFANSYLYEDMATKRLNVTEEMVELAGREAEITRIVRVYGDCGISYNIKEDDGEWLWCANMFDGYASDHPELTIDVDSMFCGGESA